MTQEQYYVISISIQSIAIILTIISLVFACVQLRQIKINRKRQFEQSRREKTVELVLRYVSENDDKTRFVESIVSQLTDAQCQDLYDGTPFSVDKKIKEQLCELCPYKKDCEKTPEKPTCMDSNNEYVVKGKLLFFLRGTIIKYLNSLESILLAWQLRIVDQDSLQEQFAFLDKKRHKDRAVEAFRTIAGNGKSYPAIEKFYQYLDYKNMEDAEKSLKDILK